MCLTPQHEVPSVEAAPDPQLTYGWLVKGYWPPNGWDEGTTIDPNLALEIAIGWEAQGATTSIRPCAWK